MKCAVRAMEIVTYFLAYQCVTENEQQLLEDARETPRVHMNMVMNTSAIDVAIAEAETRTQQS
jgi:hypothetical protein